MIIDERLNKGNDNFEIHKILNNDGKFIECSITSVLDANHNTIHCITLLDDITVAVRYIHKHELVIYRGEWINN